MEMQKSEFATHCSTGTMSNGTAWSGMLQYPVPSSRMVGSGALLLGLILLGVATAWLLDPLKHVPGPASLKVNPFWLSRQCRLLRRAHAVHELHRKYGPVVRIGPNHVSVISTACLAQIYGSRSGSAKGPYYGIFGFGSTTLFSTRDINFHARRRKAIVPGLHKGPVRAFEQHMTTQILNFKQTLLRKIKDGDGAAYLDFKTWANYLAFDIIADFMFGNPFGYVEAGTDFHNLIASIDNRLRCMNALATLPPWARPLVKWFSFDPFWTESEPTTMNLREVAAKSLAARKELQSGTNSAERNDMMAFLTKTKQEDGTPLPETDIIAETASFISGGSDTTSTTLTHFVDLVSRHPNVKRRLQAELDNAFPGPQSDDWVPSDESIASLPYLNACLNESMRVQPGAASGLERIVLSESITVGDKGDTQYVLPRGTLVSTAVYSLHRRESVFVDAESFSPERWLGKKGPELDALNASFAPFSYGLRACVGKGFAMMEVGKTAAMVFKEMDVVRATSNEPSLYYEDFFMKLHECGVVLVKR